MGRRRRSQYRRGDVRLFVGLESDIPRGWQIVEETKNRALVGAGSSYGNLQIFGADSRTPNVWTGNHVLSVEQLAHHGHTIPATISDAYFQYSGGGGLPGIYQPSHTNRGSYGTGSNWGHAHAVGASALDTRQLSVGIYVIKRV